MFLSMYRNEINLIFIILKTGLNFLSFNLISSLSNVVI